MGRISEQRIRVNGKREPLAPAVEVGQIGMNKRASVGDIARICRAVEILGKEWPRLPQVRPVFDIVNLDQGRDFLQETKRYAIVLVHSVFHAREDFMCKMKGYWREKKIPPLISAHHTEDRWRERLVSTGAEHILVFESLPFSLNGWQLGDLSGYGIRLRTHEITHYVKGE